MDLAVLHQLMKAGRSVHSAARRLLFERGQRGRGEGDGDRGRGAETPQPSASPSAVPSQWSVVCETHAVTSPDFVRESDDFSRSSPIGTRRVDGWEAIICLPGGPPRRPLVRASSPLLVSCPSWSSSARRCSPCLRTGSPGGRSAISASRRSAIWRRTAASQAPRAHRCRSSSPVPWRRKPIRRRRWPARRARRAPSSARPRRRRAGRPRSCRRAAPPSVPMTRRTPCRRP